MAMDGFSKFGICLICMLALLLLAVTPYTATPDGGVGSVGERAPANLSSVGQSSFHT